MICIFIDALKPEYIEKTTFLKEIAENNLSGNLEVTFGFTSILPSFLTGCYPDTHRKIDLFDLDQEMKPKTKSRLLINLRLLLKNNRFFFTPLNSEYYKYFKVSQEKAWPQKNSLPVKTIFDILEDKKLISIDWPNIYINRKSKLFFKNDCKTVLDITKKLIKSKPDFLFVHFLDLEIAHKYGTTSNELKEKLTEIDNAVRELAFLDDNLIIFSDHSMDEVREKFDIKERLDSLKLDFGKDLVYFIGSTFVRFWFKSQEAKKSVESLLRSLEEGRIVNFKEYNLPKTCDLIFLANFGTIFYPNLFNTEYQAMHGWDPKIQKTFYIIKNLKGKKDTHIINLLPTILDLMKIKKPKLDGNSLVNE
ncbi:alkaline phosphatase family protein [Candidatus Woesearchaeota archaeon]|nr:alkaline phosphatase family protein [Candidatus Woesearchaeota archaeon]